MNILVVCNYGLYQDFSCSFVHAQTAAYAALGHRVRVIIPIAIGKKDWDGKALSGPLLRREEDGVELYLLRHLSLSVYGKKRFNTISALYAVRKQLHGILLEFMPDVIHAHTLGFCSEIGTWLKRKLNIPLIVTSHGSDTTIPMDHGEHEEMKSFCDSADEIVLVSTALKNRLFPCGTATPLRVIHNGFQIKHLCEETQKNPRSFLQISNLIELKKVDVTISAFAKIHDVYPDAVLTIIGTGPKMSELKTLCQQLEIERNVHFLGQISNLQVFQELAGTQFYIMPSIREGFGIVYLEAMASRCITIGTEGGGIADLIVSGENGFLVPPDNPEAITQTVEWCIEHPQCAAAIAKRGQKAAIELTWERNAEQYLVLFKELAG